MIDKPEINHKVCILNQIPGMYITSPVNFLTKSFVSFTKLFVKKIFEPWINADKKLFLNYEQLLYGTNLAKKWKTNLQ